MAKSVAAIICAAGPGSRFGGKRKKQFMDVGGRAVFLRSVELFSGRDDVKQVLLGIPREDEEIVTVKWGANLKFFNVKVFFGGRERFDTAIEGLKLVKEGIELVAVHDACRCCATEELIGKVIAKAGATGAAIPGAPVTATLKQVQDGVIVKTVDRGGLYEAQTPQVFETALLRKAYGNPGNVDRAAVTDDALLVEAIGHKVAIVESDASNLKITKPSDIAIAEAILKSRPKPKPEGPIGPYIEAQW
ncbi:MAG: 2-C-methyl-D-erythritol 4-phosphate cytidylyltransferase [Sedimentisphaerales bacterium]|nr:2-C-methyl-D-erythritol 4-phosphate cytidylyltransferase [Sedimentisphaerales bacterium]